PPATDIELPKTKPNSSTMMAGKASPETMGPGERIQWIRSRWVTVHESAIAHPRRDFERRWISTLSKIWDAGTVEVGAFMASPPLPGRCPLDPRRTRCQWRVW